MAPPKAKTVKSYEGIVTWDDENIARLTTVEKVSVEGTGKLLSIEKISSVTGLIHAVKQYGAARFGLKTFTERERPKDALAEAAAMESAAYERRDAEDAALRKAEKVATRAETREAKHARKVMPAPDAPISDDTADLKAAAVRRAEAARARADKKLNRHARKVAG
jgi:hypothetical protein